MDADRDFGALQDAIVEAFVDTKELREFAQRRVSEKLRSKLPEGPMARVAFELIERVRAEGQIDTLVSALRTERPANRIVQDSLLKFESLTRTAIPDAPRAELGRELLRRIELWRAATGDARKQAKASMEELRSSLRKGPELQEGEVLGAEPRFLLREKVADDGVVAVWRAQDLEEEWQFVVVKVIKDPAWIDRCDQSLRAASPNSDIFVKVVAKRAEYDDKFPYYVTGWPEQGDLWEATLQKQGGRLFLAQALDLLRRIGEKLASLHALKGADSRPLAHGAVTPRHVFLYVETGGLSARLSEPGGPPPTSLEVAAYIAPELRGASVATEASDQYGLAMTLLFVVLARPGLCPADVANVTFDTLRDVLARALSEKPASRYESVSDFCKALDAARAQIPRQALLRPSDVVAVHDTLLAIPGDRQAFRREVISRMSLNGRQLREIDTLPSVRTEAQQWSYFVRDLVALCQDRIEELTRVTDDLAPRLGPAPVGTADPRQVSQGASMPSLYWRLCHSAEGVLESLALRLGFWEVVTSDTATPAKRARVLLLGAQRKFTLVEVCARLDALEQQSARPDVLREAPIRQHSAPWLHEQLAFALERATQAIAPSDTTGSHELPEEMGRVQDFLVARDYEWLQAELGNVWRGIVRYFRRRKAEIPQDLFESFDHIDSVARRLSTTAREYGRARSSTPEAARGLYQAFLTMPEEILDRVAEGCDIELWALPAYDEGAAWRALHVAAFCIAWLPQDRPWTVVWSRLELFVRDQLAGDGSVLIGALRTRNPDEILRVCTEFQVPEDAPEVQVPEGDSEIPVSEDAPEGLAPKAAPSPRAYVRKVLRAVALAFPRPDPQRRSGAVKEAAGDLLGTMPDVHFAELCLYLGESIQVADRDLRVTLWVDAHGPVEDETSRLSRALAFVWDDLPPWARGPTQLADASEDGPTREAMLDGMARLAPDAFDPLCERLNVARARMPASLASYARRTSSVLGYCQALPGGVRRLAQEIAAMNEAGVT
jgi:hypothetical protein